MREKGFLSGSIPVRLTSADPETSLREINDLGIPVWELREVDPLTLTFRINDQYVSALSVIAARKGYKLEILKISQRSFALQRLLHRPIPILMTLLLMVMVFVLPGRILFVEVEGNQIIPSNRIIEAAAESGVRFWSSRREVRSEQVKNSMLGQLPDLQWVGINTYGCRAVISVRERPEGESVEEIPPVSSIVAGCDGILTSLTVTKGTGLVQPGQAVLEGQVLISGYTDNGLIICAAAAEGEANAVTGREITAVTPLLQRIRTSVLSKHLNFAVQIGKKRINFLKGSGISGGRCVKMYSKYVLSLPGGFVLPVALIKETVLEFELDEISADEDLLSGHLSEAAQDYLRFRMIGGTILIKTETSELTDGVLKLHGHYVCTEMIGRRKVEMIGE